MEASAAAEALKALVAKESVGAGGAGLPSVGALACDSASSLGGPAPSRPAARGPRIARRPPAGTATLRGAFGSRRERNGAVAQRDRGARFGRDPR